MDLIVHGLFFLIPSLFHIYFPHLDITAIPKRVHVLQRCEFCLFFSDYLLYFKVYFPYNGERSLKI